MEELKYHNLGTRALNLLSISSLNTECDGVAALIGCHINRTTKYCEMVKPIMSVKTFPCEWNLRYMLLPAAPPQVDHHSIIA